MTIQGSGQSSTDAVEETGQYKIVREEDLFRVTQEHEVSDERSPETYMGRLIVSPAMQSTLRYYSVKVRLLEQALRQQIAAGNRASDE